MDVTFSCRRHVGVFMAVCDGVPSCCRHPCKMPVLLLQDVTITLDIAITETINTLFLVNFLQVAQLSQRDRAAGWVSNGQKWKTGTERQYLRTI